MSFTGKLGSADAKLANIELASVGFFDPFEQEASSVLTFVSEATASVEYAAEVVESEITFVSTATAVIAKIGIASSALALTSDAVPLQLWQHVTQPMALVGEAEYSAPFYEYVQTQMHLEQNAIGNTAKYYFLSSPIAFVQGCGRPIEVEAESAITFVSSAERRNLANSTIVFVSSAVAGKGGVASSPLGIDHSVDRQLIATRPVEHELNLSSSVAYEVVRANDCSEKQYTPFIGGGDFLVYGEDPPPSTLAPLGSATLTLTWPYTSPTETLVLKNPQFGNTDSLNFNRINRESRGGTLIVFADPDWPKSRTLTFEVAGLKRSQADDLQAFFLTSIGQEIGLLDHEARLWRGFITTPEAEISEVSKKNLRVQFSFEGELV